jgi:hypothetical protein
MASAIVVSGALQVASEACSSPLQAVDDSTSLPCPHLAWGLEVAFRIWRICRQEASRTATLGS